MRLVVLSLFLVPGILYAFASVESYREELRARQPLPIVAPSDAAPLHPEANLARLRAALASEEYTDDLKPYLERALRQAPTFYQPPFLLAAFHANRLEHPETIDDAFEAAIARFPSNGRLHLTYAEWLLTPRQTAPYRAYRADVGPSATAARARALSHASKATTLEPDLSRATIDVLLRLRVPSETWTDVLPPGGTTRSLILFAMDRTPVKRTVRRDVMTSFLDDADDVSTLRAVTILGRKWGENELAMKAAKRWHALAMDLDSPPGLSEAALHLAGGYLNESRADQAYETVRSTVMRFEERGVPNEAPDLLALVGDLYLAHRHDAMAESLFTEALTLSPYHVAARIGLARTYQRDGDEQSAARELGEVLQLDPGNARARQLLDQLERDR